MISEKTISTLELHKILQDSVVVHDLSAPAKNSPSSSTPRPSWKRCSLWQRETAEAVALLEESSSISLRGARDVRDPVVKSLRGVIVEPGVLLDIAIRCGAARP